MAVASEEFLNPERIRGMVGAHEGDVAYALRQQFDTRRRMKARIRISLNSASVCTSERAFPRLSSITSPG